MTFNDLINKINQFIVANNNREITADILNPILKDIANYFSGQVGNLDNSSVSGSDVVAKINTLNTLISQVNGMVILTGESNPNVTPPANYTVGNMYMQNVGGLVLAFYIYNGTEWAVLKNWINDNVTSDVLTWSSEKIINYINNRNELISTNGYLLTDSSITFYAGARWRINNVIYTNINDITIPVPIASSNMYRTDLYAGNASGQIVRVAGVESSSLQAAPNLPANTVAITESTTYGSNTSLQPLPNLDGLKPKLESGIVYFNDTGALNNLNLVGQEGHLYLNSATELKSVQITNGWQPYNGKQLILTNNSLVDITIKNNATGTNVFTPFIFTTGADYFLKPKESIVFYYSMQYGKFMFLSSNMSVASSQSNVVLLDTNPDGTVYSQGVTGNVVLKTYNIPMSLLRKNGVFRISVRMSKPEGVEAVFLTSVSFGTGALQFGLNTVNSGNANNKYVAATRDVKSIYNSSLSYFKMTSFGGSGGYYSGWLAHANIPTQTNVSYSGEYLPVRLFINTTSTTDKIVLDYLMIEFLHD